MSDTLPPSAATPPKDLLEPEANEHPDPVLASIAISLKRIADAIHFQGSSYDNPISRAISDGIGNGAQDWIGHLARNGR